MEGSRGSSRVAGTAGTKVCRLEVRPSQEKGGLGFELRMRSQLPGTDTKPGKSRASAILVAAKLVPGPCVRWSQWGTLSFLPG